MAGAIVIMFGLFFVDNANFFKTTESQRAEGYTWQKLDDCRAPESVPHLSTRNSKDEEVVCYKLEK